ncbi:MAG: MerR family transcriptional regulator [Limnohabitans sp.]|nr:MerR family transcriptional regulator [Limnohabitans sp.]
MNARLPDLLNAIPPEGVPLEALAHLVNQALDDAQLAVDDKRASETLDGRTIRFYQSLGILPRPEYIGRRAMYGRDHLLRAFAAKQLQSEGYSLAQIQSALPTQSSDELFDAIAASREHSSVGFGATPHSAARTTAAHSTRALVTHEVARGVLVTIDPALVTNPTALLELLTNTTQRAISQSANHGGKS